MKIPKWLEGPEIPSICRDYAKRGFAFIVWPQKITVVGWHGFVWRIVVTVHDDLPDELLCTDPIYGDFASLNDAQQYCRNLANRLNNELGAKCMPLKEYSFEAVGSIAVYGPPAE